MIKVDILLISSAIGHRCKKSIRLQKMVIRLRTPKIGVRRGYICFRNHN